MEHPAEKKLADLKERLASGEYAIDPQAVADAILRRSREVALLRATAEMRATPSSNDLRSGPTGRPGGGSSTPHSTCSYPSRRLAASWKLAPGEPWMTRPIHVIRTLGSALATAASNTARALGGTQAQSS